VQGHDGARRVAEALTLPVPSCSRGAAGLAAVVLAICASSAAAPAASSFGDRSPTPVTGPGAASVASLGRCPASAPISSLPVFARPTTVPDDLTVGPNGDVWVTATTQGHILDYAANGTLRVDLPDPNAPEGIVITASRTVVAEQAVNRLVLLASDGTLTPFLKLSDRTGRMGIDGLGFDAQRGRLLVPNSPEGTLLSTPLTAASPRLLAKGLGRPVAAAVGPNGAIYVAAESQPGLLRVPARGGPAKRFGNLSDLDEVVADGGLLYTIGAGDGTIRAVDPVTGADRVIATGGRQLQGLAPLPDGRLLVIDSTTHAISYVPACQ
jgi:glucose/arabinose dehydrogenase